METSMPRRLWTRTPRAVMKAGMGTRAPRGPLPEARQSPILTRGTAGVAGPWPTPPGLLLGEGRGDLLARPVGVRGRPWRPPRLGLEGTRGGAGPRLFGVGGGV